MDKKDLSEQDVRTKFILPAIEAAGWDVDEQVREEVVLSAGPVVVRGRKTERGKTLKADYVLHWKPGVPIAVVEAKDNNHAVGAGLEQANGYAEKLDVPFAFSSNGDGFVFRDHTGLAAEAEQSLRLDEFPKPYELWERYRAWKKLPPEAIPLIEQPYHDDERPLRYYQITAVNRVIEAVARGEQRALLVMATGTGKTFTAFQIAWRLKRAGRVTRVLFLTDRDALAGQAMRGDFGPFGGKMTRVGGQKIDPSYEVYFALYQSLVSDLDAESTYRKVSPKFFDLVIVDECHRGSANDDANWRKVLEYFKGAIQLGLTATPHEAPGGSNSNYFGEAVYTYSLKQGIEDGFLAPYKVIRVDMDRDMKGWRPAAGQLDDHGVAIPLKDYGRPEIDRLLVLRERTRKVAERVMELLRATDPYAKTIVFCEDIEHATRMRQALVNAASDLVAEDKDYVARITGDVPNVAGLLDRFSDPASRYPVVVTTSDLLSTGVDVKTCQVVVLDQVVDSMTRFKQIIGRGTRLLESHGKFFFTIVDFKGVTRLFEDRAFDGTPVSVYQPDKDAPITPPDDDDADAHGDDGASPQRFTVSQRGHSGAKFYVSGVPVAVHSEQTLNYAEHRLISASLRDEARDEVRRRFEGVRELRAAWRVAERRGALVDELREKGVLVSALQELFDDPMDPSDLLASTAFDAPVVTRATRAARVREGGVLSAYAPAAAEVLEALLALYEREGPFAVEDPSVLKIPDLQSIGTVVELVGRFSGRDGFGDARRALLDALYRDDAEVS